MKKKLILTLSFMIFIFGLIGCNKDNGETIKDTISNNYAEVNGEDLEILEWSYSAKEPDNPDKK